MKIELIKKELYSYLICVFLMGCGSNNSNYANDSAATTKVNRIDTTSAATIAVTKITEPDTEIAATDNILESHNSISQPKNNSTSVIVGEDKLKEENTSSSELYAAPASLQTKEETNQASNVPGLANIIAELEDYRLFKSSNYNSGNGSSNGMSSQKYYDLCAGGYFTYYYSSDIVTDNASGNTSSTETGKWWVEKANNGFVLLFKSAAGKQWSFNVAINEEHQLFLNGSRWYHVPKGDSYGNGPTSCN